MEIDLEALPDDADALRAIIVARHQALTGMQASNRACEALVQALKITIARLKKQRFGASSEKIEREIQQLELALESLETARAAADAAPEPEEGGAEDDAPTAPAERAPQRRRGEPRIAEDAPREIIPLDPGERCPDCGGALRLVGEGEEDQETVRWTVSPTNAEILDFIAARLKVVEVHRPKKSCRDCERMVQTPAPPRRSAGRPSAGRPPCPPHPAGHGQPRAARAHPGRQARRSTPALQAGPSPLSLGPAARQGSASPAWAPFAIVLGPMAANGSARARR